MSVITPAVLAVTTARPAVTVRSSGVIIATARLAVTSARPAVRITAIRKAIIVTTVATRGSVASGVTASGSLASAGTGGSATALLTARRDRLTAAPDTDSSLDAAATTGEGGP